MKKIFKTMAFVLMATIMAVGCGSDDEPIKPDNNEKQPEQEQPEQKEEELPTVDEASVCCKNGYIVFSATRPSSSYYFKVYVSAQQEGAQEKEYSVEYFTGKQQYQAKAVDLKRGEKYWCRVGGFNFKDEKVMETARLTIEIGKDDGPAAPSVSGITIVPPTSKNAADAQLQGKVITTDMEYSTDEGKTWTPVSTDGVITGLKSGTVLLRYKETDTKQAGQTASITIPEHNSNTDAGGEGGKSEGMV